MARRVGEYLELSGPIFEPDAAKRFNRAVGKGIEEMGKDVADIGVAAAGAAGVIDSGRYISSWASKFTQTRGAGFATVRPSDVYPKAGRPTRTWIDKGVRRGVKLRAGRNITSKTRTRARQLSLSGYFERLIQEALN